MSKFFVTSPLAAKSNAPVVSTQQPAPEFDLDPGFGDLDSPSFGLQLDGLVEPQPLFDSDANLGDAPAKTSRSKLTNKSANAGKKADANQTNTKGELVQDPSDATSIMLALDEKTDDPTPDTFLSNFWPYLMVAIALTGWVIFQLRLKSAPSFKLKSRKSRKQSRTSPKKASPKKTIATSSPALTGEFKASQRFQKPKSKVEAKSKVEVDTGGVDTAKRTSGFVSSKSTDQREVNAIDSDRPADDEFEVESLDGISDSDVIDEKEAAEIVARVDARQAEGLRGPSARFKAEIGDQKVKPKDRV